jgi:hypothetical protein
MTSPSPKMILLTYKIVVHPLRTARGTFCQCR